MGVPARVYLHVGLHKTGTTFLQNLFRVNVEGLAAQCVDFPHGDDEPAQNLAVWDLLGRRPRATKDPRIAGQWPALVERVNASMLPTVLISEERLSISTLNLARKVVGAFPESEVHVIVTARDLGRVAVSSWQEDVKNDTTATWQEYLHAIQDPRRASQNPARGFWMRQDLLKICETWETVVSAQRLHLVTVPPVGSDPGVLAARFGSVVGFDPAMLTHPPPWDNQTVGVAGTEVIRRVNQRLGGRLNQIQYDALVKRTIVRMLATRTDTVRSGLSAEDLPWVAERSEHWIAEIRMRGYDVVGDLDDLRPRAQGVGRSPDDVSDEELSEAALDALAMLAEEYSQKWWMRRRLTLAEVEESRDLGSRRRAMVYKSQLWASHLADRNRVAAKAMDVVVKSRDRARKRARHKQRQQS